MSRTTSYLTFQLKQNFLSKKNWGVCLIFLIWSFWFCYQYLPAHGTLENFSRQQVTDTLLKNEKFMKTFKPAFPNYPTIANAGKYVPRFMTSERAQLAAARKGEYKQVAASMKEELLLTDQLILQGQPWISYPLQYYSDPNVMRDAGSGNQNRNGHYWNLEARTRLGKYAHMKSNEINEAVINQQTALQQLKRAFFYGLALAILIATAVMSTDLVTRDSKRQSILKNFPLTTWGMVNCKSLSALLMGGGLFLVFLVILLPFNIVKFGLGSLTLPISVYGGNSFTTISLGQFMLEVFVLTLLSMWLVIRLQIALQLLLKSEFSSLAVTMFLLVSESLYFLPGLVSINSWTLYLLPSYFNIGQLVTGFQNFRYETTKMTFGLAMILFVLTLIVVEIIIYWLTHQHPIRKAVRLHHA
ncbi:hypothetical protein AUQ39_08615 [Lacticaseibacillus casei]|uniref:Uncharacterized protein n=1 Tax=Lacticaseibacillus zeae TaxID=57037 RepID=A0A5R8LKI8_LACZE|nr:MULTISPECIES: hypothetical protein [Lacticaseibacillus]MDE3283272.1 hypothetical protein [Lacticaseibacillus casei]OLS07690.1 hypothetical protein AUQ39_08615 [Lacticaseibacillus casei]QVI31437.1 hypothetical protein KG087_10990 [Lacticaseibacillus zeae]TLF37727.1 hypothetical protein FEI14_15225 [Lacticaseibacillus zeae]